MRKSIAILAVAVALVVSVFAGVTVGHSVADLMTDSPSEEAR